MSLVVTMVSCVQRASNRRRTLAQFDALGLPVRVIESACNPAGDASMTLAADEAGRVALSEPGAWLFIEDDIDLAPDFAWHLDRALELDSITYLYFNDSHTRMRMQLGKSLADRIMNQEPIQRGPVELLQRAALFGTQCVLIPERLKAKAHEVMTRPQKNAEPPDSRLHTWLRADRTERVFTMLPHPVQHRQDRTGREWTPRVMRSLSYGVPYLLEDGSASHSPTPRGFDIH